MAFHNLRKVYSKDNLPKNYAANGVEMNVRVIELDENTEQMTVSVITPFEGYYTFIYYSYDDEFRFESIEGY